MDSTWTEEIKEKDTDSTAILHKNTKMKIELNVLKNVIPDVMYVKELL